MIEVLITARVQVETIPDEVFEKFAGDVSLGVANHVLRELPKGMVYAERTACLTSIKRLRRESQ